MRPAFPSSLHFLDSVPRYPTYYSHQILYSRFDLLCRLVLPAVDKTAWSSCRTWLPASSLTSHYRVTPGRVNRGLATGAGNWQPAEWNLGQSSRGTGNRQGLANVVEFLGLQRRLALGSWMPIFNRRINRCSAKFNLERNVDKFCRLIPAIDSTAWVYFHA